MGFEIVWTLPALADFEAIGDYLAGQSPTAAEKVGAAILEHVGQPADFCAGHKEYALPRGRKNDPNFDMIEFRKGVAALLQGTTPAPAPKPTPAPKPAPAASKPAPAKPEAKKGAAAGRGKR